MCVNVKVLFIIFNVEKRVEKKIFYEIDKLFNYLNI